MLKSGKRMGANEWDVERVCAYLNPARGDLFIARNDPPARLLLLLLLCLFECA